MISDEVIKDKEQLIQYFAAAATPQQDWKIGLECETFAVDLKTLQSVPYRGEKGIEGILEELATNYGWEPNVEDNALLGLTRGSSRITLEPGGQIELSGSPFTLIEDCLRERDKYVADLKAVTAKKGLGLLAAGYQPISTVENTQWLPKKRYQEMSQHFSARGGYLAHHMMKLTTTVQASIDYENEADFGQKMLLAHYLTPILQAIYANSPFKQGIFSGYLDFRGFVWEHTDDARCGFLPKALQGEYSYEDYVDYLLNVPMILRYEGAQVLPMQGITFKEYLKSSQATMADWDSHSSFVFPEVRVRNYIELRMCDSVKPKLIPTIPALIKGIFYDAASRNKLLDYFSRYSPVEMESLYREVHQKALQAEIKGQKVLEIAREMTSVAEQGLKNLAKEGQLSQSQEAKYLDPLKEQLWDKGLSPAEELLNMWEANNRDLLKIKDQLLY